MKLAQSKLDLAREIVLSANEGATVTSTERPDGTIAIEASQMYEYINVTFALMKELAELFGTDKIDTDQESSSGCETCDYGSDYIVTFIIEGAS
jgi:hypothetical protein